MFHTYFSIKSQELPVTPRKPSSGGSTPSDKRSASPSPSNSKHTPVSGGSKSGKTSHDGIQSPDMHPNRPSRPGITWIVNGKLEAMDFQQKWYCNYLVILTILHYNYISSYYVITMLTQL